MRIKARLWGSRKRRVVSLLAAFALAITGVAAAAFIVFSGASGSQSGSFTSSTTSQTAISISGSTTPSLVPGAGDTAFPLVFTNADPDNPHTITAGTLTPTFSSSIPACTVYLQLGGAYPFNANIVVPAGGTNTTAGAGLMIRAMANTPISCAGATFTVDWVGATS